MSLPKPDHGSAVGRVTGHVLFAYMLLTLAMVFWSGNWVLGRAVRAEIPALELNFWRWTVASLVLVPFVWRQAVRDWPAARTHWKLIVALGATGAAFFHSMIYTGLRATEAINALLLNATSPIIIIVIAWVMYKDRISLRQFVGILLSMLGAIILVARGDAMALSAMRFNSGDQLVLAALVFWGIYSNLLKRRPAGMGGLSLLFYISVAAVVLMTPAYAWELSRSGGMEINATTLASAGYTGIFASVAAYLCYNAAIARTGPVVASFFLHLMPVFGSVMAIIFLGEQLHAYHFAGFVIVLIGISISTSRLSTGAKPG